MNNADETFAEYLYYTKKLSPFDIALKSFDDLSKLKQEWNLKKGIIEDDPVYDTLSNLSIKVSNDKLVDVIKKMTSTDSDQTNKVGTWVFYCLNKDKEKAAKAKIKVSSKYTETLTKYIDSFVKQLTHA